MKKFIPILVLISLLLVSCGKSNNTLEVLDTPLPEVSLTVIKITPTTVIPTSNLIANDSATKIPQSMDNEELSYSTNTPAPSQGCQNILIEDYSNLQGIQGTIPLMGSSYKKQDSFLLDLKTNQQILFRDEQVEDFSYKYATTSLDGKWLAYLLGDKIDDQILMIINAKGVLKKRIDLAPIRKPMDWIALEGWIDNENLLLVWPKKNANDIISPDQAISVVLNPFIGEWHEYNSDYPNIFTRYPGITYVWNSRSLSVYNQPLDRVLYLSYDGIVLWDLIEQKQIMLFTEIPEYGEIQPIWSPDGNNFVFDLDTENGRNLFLVSKDGEEKQITFMKGYKNKNINDYSWSPDGESIAFWLFRKFDKQEVFYYYDLNILNLSTQKMKSFCITSYNWRQSYSDWHPIWSPDGKYLIVATADETDLSRPMTVIVDLDNERAYKIADDMIPLGWMVSE